MNRFCRHILSIVLILSAATSCLKEKRETTYNNQENKIDQYISSKMYRKYTEDGVEKTDTLRVVYTGGANRLVLEEGTGNEELSANGTVSLYYAGYTFTGSKNSSNLFVTNHKETAVAAGWDELLNPAPDYEILTINLSQADIIEGLRDGLTGIKAGEHCEILFSGKYAFGKKPFGIIPADAAVLFEIWAVGIDNE